MTWHPMDSETHPPTKTGKEILVRLPPHEYGRRYCIVSWNDFTQEFYDDDEFPLDLSVACEWHPIPE